MSVDPITATPYEWSDGTPALAIGGSTGPDVMIANGQFSVGDAEGNSYYGPEDIDVLIAALHEAKRILSEAAE